MFLHLGECYLFLFLNLFNREPFSPFVYNRIIKRQETFDPKKVEREPYKGKDFFFICHMYPPFTRKRYIAMFWTVSPHRLGVAISWSSVFHIKMGRPVKCLAQGHNKRTCRLVLHNLPQMPRAKQGSYR